MSQSSSDGWDWDYMLAFALREMRLTEEQFWEMTPMKFHTLMAATFEIIADTSPFGSSKKKNSKGQRVVETTIDSIPGWD